MPDHVLFRFIPLPEGQLDHRKSESHFRNDVAYLLTFILNKIYALFSTQIRDSEEKKKQKKKTVAILQII
jgi:hypothetical protein